jgi:hypothetical protein
MLLLNEFYLIIFFWCYFYCVHIKVTNNIIFLASIFIYKEGVLLQHELPSMLKLLSELNLYLVIYGMVSNLYVTKQILV